MYDRFERPVKIICLALAALLAWQLGSMVLTRDPLANLKIPDLPTLPGGTNEPAKGDQKATNAVMAEKSGANGTNMSIGTNVVGGTNMVKGTNVASGTNQLASSTNGSAAGPTNQPNSTNVASKSKRPGSPKPGTPADMAQMMAGGMPGGPGGRRGGMKKMELPPEVQTRVDRIIDSEIFGPIVHPMPMALLGILDQQALIQATNGQTEAVKVGGELAGIKLLRIGINRVLVESGGEKQELTLFDGIGSASLMPKPTNGPSTNAASTNTPSTNAPIKNASKRSVAANNASTNQTLSSKQ